MKEFGVVIIVVVVVIVFIIAMAWVVQGNQFFMYKVFAPKTEAVKREVFKQSKEYQHGTIQELDKTRLEYVKTNDADIKSVMEKRALRLVAEFDKSNLPDDLR